MLLLSSPSNERWNTWFFQAPYTVVITEHLLSSFVYIYSFKSGLYNLLFHLNSRYTLYLSSTRLVLFFCKLCDLWQKLFIWDFRSPSMIFRHFLQPVLLTKLTIFPRKDGETYLRLHPPTFRFFSSNNFLHFSTRRSDINIIRVLTAALDSFLHSIRSR